MAVGFLYHPRSGATAKSFLLQLYLLHERLAHLSTLPTGSGAYWLVDSHTYKCSGLGTEQLAGAALPWVPPSGEELTLLGFLCWPALNSSGRPQVVCKSVPLSCGRLAEVRHVTRVYSCTLSPGENSLMSAFASVSCFCMTVAKTPIK